MVLSCDASLPSGGSRRARFPALGGTMKALRLPTRVSAVAYLFRFRRPRLSPRSCPPQRSRKLGDFLRARALGTPVPTLPASSYVDAYGISQVFRQSIPCLCSVPGPRSNRRVLALAATPVLPPLSGRRRLRQSFISGLTRSFSTCCPTLHAWRYRTRARLASGWPARPLPGGSRTHWIATRGFRSS
jgi:hypothetical protein